MPITPSLAAPSGAPRALRAILFPAVALATTLVLALALTSPIALAQQYQEIAPGQQALPVPGQPTVDSGGNALTSLDRAKAAHSVGDNVTAMFSIWDALENVWNMMGELGIRNAAFILNPAEYFGIYQPKQGQDFMPGEPIILYCEPFGYTMRKEADGTYTQSLSWSFRILDQQGNVQGRQDNIGPYTQGGYRTFATENMLSLTINLSQFPAGSYVLSVTISDDFNANKFVEIQKPFNIIPAN
ncbi:MAG: hypothetical protein LBR80_00435 [Deltaproteobacteria bacterium]|jgi:hypothetical protein|nr:hypothetical protein [Deltaproteobacteria bacterium]